MRSFIDIPTPRRHYTDQPKSPSFPLCQRGMKGAFFDRTMLALAIFLWPELAFASLQQVREVHYQMGTFLELTLWQEETETAKRLIRQAVVEVHRLEEVFSNFDPDSDLSRFNELAGKGKIDLNPDLYQILKIAVAFGARTGGYFDVTVGPLVRLWKQSLSLGTLPSQEALVKTLSLVGYEKLKLYPNRQAALGPAMELDLGGIGKGYAVDRIADRLRVAGVTSALINFGGSSICALGAPPGRRAWEIGIEAPDKTLRGVIQLRDRALSTSGSMGQFWLVGGKKYGHLINPKNGMPVTEARAATAVMSSATAAEALTKPLAIIGSDALSLIDRFPGAEAAVIPANGQLSFSKSFKAKTNWRELPAT